MNKKSFFGGLISGVVICSILAGGYVAASVLDKGSIKQYDAQAKVDYIMSMLNEYYVDELNYDQMTEGLYKGIVAGVGDPYTTYLTADEFASLTDDTAGNFSGIGVTVSAQEYYDGIEIVNTLNGPAQDAGVLAGDIITKVDDQSIEGLGLQNAVNLIKGEEGSEVKITVYRPSESREIDFVMKRSNIEVISVNGEMLENSIGYVKIDQFSQNTYDQFKAEVEKLQAQNMKGLIIDVRDNPGGVVTGVRDITDMLVGEGTMVYTIDKNGNREDFKSDANKLGLPLAVLINGNSASASEILSGAVQDMGEGVLVGTQSFGKGLVQGVYQLPDSSGIKITIQKYYTPKGVCIQGTGLTPDYVVELENGITNSNLVSREDDTQLKKAIEVISEKIN